MPHQAGDELWPARDGFWSAVNTADVVLSNPSLERHWGDESVLPEMTVGEVAAHLARAVATLVTYVSGADEPDGRAVSAAEYFVALIPDPSDIASTANAGVRQRSRDDARPGYQALLGRWHEAITGARDALDRLHPSHSVAVARGLVLTLDEYLRTRTLELVVHTDDLALSVGLTPPEPAPAAARVVAHTLLDVARLRSGDLTVLRAMARHERQPCSVLRAF